MENLWIGISGMRLNRVTLMRWLLLLLVIGASFFAGLYLRFNALKECAWIEWNRRADEVLCQQGLAREDTRCRLAEFARSHPSRP
jgi:hypothetical protein